MPSMAIRRPSTPGSPGSCGCWRRGLPTRGCSPASLPVLSVWPTMRTSEYGLLRRPSQTGAAPAQSWAGCQSDPRQKEMSLGMFSISWLSAVCDTAMPCRAWPVPSRAFAAPCLRPDVVPRAPRLRPPGTRARVAAGGRADHRPRQAFPPRASSALRVVHALRSPYQNDSGADAQKNVFAHVRAPWKYRCARRHRHRGARYPRCRNDRAQGRVRHQHRQASGVGQRRMCDAGGKRRAPTARRWRVCDRPGLRGSGPGRAQIQLAAFAA